LYDLQEGYLSANTLEWLQEHLASSAATINVSLVQTDKSASFRISMPVVQPPTFKEQSARAALEAWSSLLAWWSNQKKIT